MKKIPTNLFQDIPEGLNQELVERLVERDTIRIERIVSRGQSSPSDFWYDQDEHEWVVILAGQAKLSIEGEKEFVNLGPGDTYDLPAHTKHRVVWTAPNLNTIWLAVFWKD